MSQTGAGKTKIVFDSADLANSDQIGANTMAGGVVVTATGTSMDVNVTGSALPTGAATETTLASVLSELQGLSHAEDAAHVSGDLGIMGLAVRNDAGTSLVSADGDYSPLSLDSAGALRVSFGGTITANIEGDYEEDSAHVSGDRGLFSLGVRNDAQAATATSANGDYSQISVNGKGAMYVKDIANGANLQQVITVGTTAVQLPALSLANRSSMMIQMLSGGQLYLGSSTVGNSGATRGFLLGNGGFVSLDVGPACAIYGIANAAGKDVVVWEFAE